MSTESTEIILKKCLRLVEEVAKLLGAEYTAKSPRDRAIAALKLDTAVTTLLASSDEAPKK